MDAPESWAECWALDLAARTGGRELPFPDGELPPADYWVHVDRTTPGVPWLEQQFTGEPELWEAILADTARPRATPFDRGMLVILRGANFNKGEDLEDMVSVRIWLEKGRLLTYCRRKVISVREVRDQVRVHKSACSPATVLIMLADRILDRFEPVVGELEEAIDELMERVNQEEAYEDRSSLVAVRNQLIHFRRYLVPQREALQSLVREPGGYFQGRLLARLRETREQTSRIVEQMQSMVERTALIRDELVNRSNERLNRNMYLLSVVAAIFLPLSFATGLLGINVGGIPGAEVSIAFWVVCGIMVVLAVAMIVVLRRMKVI